MTERPSGRRASLCLSALLLLCFFVDDRFFVFGEPEPIPSELLYGENFNNAENLILLNKLQQVIDERKDTEEREKELGDVEMIIESVLEAKAKSKTRPGDYPFEELPTPNAIVGQGKRSGKRTPISYMTLCHFKICNMGRKRQLHN